MVDSELRHARTIGRYAIFAEIASGGMASVHIGRLLGPVGFSRTVAIKRLHPQFARDPEFVTMFLDEARLAARIRHPNVASTLDVVATQGELFLVMEYIQGESLGQLLWTANDAGKSIPHDIVRTIMSGVLHGLHAAHEAKSERGEALGIVHRDVSPQNIIVGTDGIARLLDFGVAKAVSRAHVTRDRHIKGKLSYMAPEQIQNLAIDRRVDVYAASVVVWELLTGERLFLADSESATLARVLTCSVAPPSTIGHAVSYRLDQVVLRGVKRNPELRYANAREMALALEASGRMATTSAVGEWVEQTARVALAARAAKIAAVEQIDDMSAASQSSRPPPIVRRLALVTESTADVSTADAPAAETSETREPWSETTENAAPETQSPFVEDSSIELVPAEQASAVRQAVAPALPPGKSSPNRKRTAATIGAIAIALGVVAWFGWNRLRAVPETKSTTIVGSSIDTPSPPLSSQSELSATEAPPAAESTEEELTATSKLPDEEPPVGDAKENTKALVGSPPVGMVRTKLKPPGCNPPYTIDAAGIRHYKRKCL